MATIKKDIRLPFPTLPIILTNLQANHRPLQHLLPQQILPLKYLINPHWYSHNILLIRERGMHLLRPQHPSFSIILLHKLLGLARLDDVDSRRQIREVVFYAFLGLILVRAVNCYRIHCDSRHEFLELLLPVLLGFAAELGVDLAETDDAGVFEGCGVLFVEL